MFLTTAPAPATTDEEPPGAPALIVSLFAALRSRGVRYCHWKSNLRLEQGLLGQTDLDLLVDPAQQQQLVAILGEHGALPVRAAPGGEYPAVENYLAFDEPSGRLFHLHVHYQLVLGERFVKNYRLPLEEQFLRSARLCHGVYVPAPELELIVLALRALLKYRNRDVVKDVLKIRHPGLPTQITDEIVWLMGQTSLGRVAEQLRELEPGVPAEPVLELLRTVTATPRDGLGLLRLRGRVRRMLRGHQRSGRAWAALTYARGLWRQRSAALLHRPPRAMTLLDGGRSLALVGADGAGKSTLCRQLYGWLRWKLDAHVYYLGSKEPSRRSELLYVLFRMARRGQREVGGALGEAHPLARLLKRLRQTLLYGHCLSIGHDRYARYLAGRAHVRAGSVVIFDRYPLETISPGSEHQLLDGPQIPLIAEGDSGLIRRAFASAERRLYRNILPPDHLFVLDVSPAVSIQRKPDHRREVIVAKSRVVRELATVAGSNGGTFGLVVIDADQPLDAVLHRLKGLVWQALT